MSLHYLLKLISRVLRKFRCQKIIKSNKFYLFTVMVAKRCTHNCNVTVTETLVLRPLLEDRGRNTESVLVPVVNVFRLRRNESVDCSSFSSVGSLFHARGAATEKAVANSSTCRRINK